MRRFVALVLAASAAAGCHDRLTLEPAPAINAAALLDPVSSPTNVATAAVSGTALPGATVDFSGGSSPVQATADSAGRFSATVPLNTAPGVVTVNDVVVTYAAGGVGSSPALARIVHDPVAPFPAYVTVNPGTTSLNPAAVQGNAEANSGIIVYGGQATATTRVDQNGDFTILVQLPAKSDNSLTV